MKSTLTIKDLAVSKELDSRAMSAVRGGANINAFNYNVANGGGFGSPGTVFAPVTQVDMPTKVDTTVLQNFGGIQAFNVA
jgi:hypothetical protein